MPLAIEVREPCGDAEFEQYCHLRWRILRQPLGLPRPLGPYEPGTIHLAAWMNGHAVATGRIYLDSPDQAHVRGVAVEPSCLRRGIGRAIVAELERRARERGATCTVLEARYAAVAFFEKQGYRAVGELPPEFHPVRCFRMFKKL